MRLTSFTDYGLRALMRLAAVPGQGLSTALLAEELHISRNHLAKVILALSRAGYVATRRGSGGGAALARPAREIRLGEVVRVLERGQAIAECFAHDGGRCTLNGRCKLQGRLRIAEEAFLQNLNRSTLDQIALGAAEPAFPLPA